LARRNIIAISFESNLIINNRYNLALIALLFNSTPVLLLKDTRPFNITIETALKHPSLTTLKSLDNISRILFFASSSSNVGLYMAIPIHSSLIRL
jgi:hypothetical protein